MKTIALILPLLLACTSCTSVTVAKSKGGAEVAHIGSFATKATNRTLRIVMPNGTILEAFGDEDQTVLPRYLAKAKLIGLGIRALPGAVDAVGRVVKP